MTASDVKRPSIYISHAWGGESEVLVNKIVDRFEREGIPLTLDKKDLAYRQSIGQFMLNLGKADAIILVVSNKYLHSEYCMFELLQIYESDNIHSRIFPIVLEEVKIAKSTERLELVRYWEEQTKELEDKIRELQSLRHIEGITDDLNLYHSIRNKIAKLTSILKDINTLNVQLHQESDFSQLIDAVKSKVLLANANNEQKSSKAVAPIIVEVPKEEKTPKKKRNLFIWLPLVIVIGGLFWAANRMFIQNKDHTAIGERLSINDEDSDFIDSNAIAVSATEEPKTETETTSSRLTSSKDKKTIPGNNEIEPRRVEKRFAQPTTESQIPGDESGPNTTLTEDKSVSNPVVQDGEESLQEVDSQEVSSKSYVEINIPDQLIEGIFTKDISSDKVKKGDVFYIESTMPIVSNGVEVIRKGARIKGVVSKSKSSKSGPRASLGVVFESIESVSGEWVDLQYPELSDIKRGEVIFKKGLKISKLRIKDSTIKILQ
jgi:hypothetical protein